MERVPQDPNLIMPMPSLAELSSILSPMQALALEGPIEFQSKEYQKTVQKQGFEDAPSEFVAFTIPLDSYLPLPGIYGSTMHTPDEKRASISIVHRTAMEAKIGTKELTAILSVIIVALGNKDTNKPLAELDETTIMTMYREAIRLANQTIIAYKLTPERHNHDLQPVTVTDRPSYVDIFRFDTTIGQILEAGTVHMHQNLVASVVRANPMSRSEHADFMKYFQALGAHLDEPAANILATIYQAIDNVCTGNYTSGLVLADTYSEHFMRYALSRLYINEGLDEENALGRVDSLRTLEKLLGGLATALGVTRPNLKRTISFESWQKACRHKRNHITHQFTKLPVEPREAREALHETINMISLLSRLIMRLNGNLAPHLWLFETPRWHTRSIEAYGINDNKSLGRVTDIKQYNYLRPGDPLPDPPPA